jgi:pimeloyl-ACP methyl ester carboxylesterase
MRRVKISALATLPSVVGLLAAVPTGAAMSYVPCAKATAAASGFSCSRLTVPLDRSGVVPGAVSLSVARKPAGATRSADAVVALAGGPGQAMLPLGARIAAAIAPALAGGSPAGRDLLLFDQRGTGDSGRLSCPALDDAAEASQARGGGELIGRCARQLGPARGAYTTRESVEDLEALRLAAGYERLVLYGTSYGTKVALQYAQRYPQHVESLLLDSTETPEGPDPFRISTFKAMKPALAELCSRKACAAASPNPLGELARLVARLSTRPLSGAVYDGHGRRSSVPVTPKDVFGLLLAGDLNPAIRAELPAAVHAALRHDGSPLARLLTLVNLRPSTETSSDIDFTLFVDTSCEETRFPWQGSAPPATRAVEAEAAVNALPSSDFYPFDAESALFDETIPICISWPAASAPVTAAGALPNVPTLILSGGQDLRTPTEDARRVASLIPDAQLLRVPYTGHSVIGSDLSGCARSAVAAFFAGVPVQACAAAVDRFPAVPAVPRSLSSVPPTRGVQGTEGRTLAAALATTLDLRRTIVTVALDLDRIPYGLRLGGLRGGTVAITKAGARLDRLSFIAGVQLSGLVPTGILLKSTGSAANLLIGGSAATPGRLRIGAGGHLSGVLGGRAFRVLASRSRTAEAGQGGHDWPIPEGPPTAALP